MAQLVSQTNPPRTVTTRVELTDLSGDNPRWRVPAGVAVTVVSDEGDWLMVEHAEYGVFGVDKTQLAEF